MSTQVVASLWKTYVIILNHLYCLLFLSVVIQFKIKSCHAVHDSVVFLM
jgi:hypothetical protein